MSNDSQLRQLIRDKYPFPISHAHTYLESRVDPNDRYQAALSCFEVTLKCIASIALANFMQDVQEDTRLGNANLFQDLLDRLSRPLSLGHWHELLRRTLRPYATRREKLVVPELLDFCYRTTEHGNVKPQSEPVRLIQRFIQERNEEAHHRNRAQVSLLRRRSRQVDLEQNLMELLRRLKFLAGYVLFYVEHAEHRSGRWHYRANFACGTGYPFRQDTWETRYSVNSYRCLLMNEAGSAVLDLHPFLIVTSEGRLQQPDIFIFDGVFSSGKAHFMSHHVGDYIEPADESSPASVASDAVSSLLRFLQNQIPAAVEGKEDAGDTLSAVEIYREAVSWAWEHGERQAISLDALRQVLRLTREEALQQERELEAKRGIEVEPEAEVPFEGDPTWANLAYYVLDASGQEQMPYKDIAAEAARLKDQYDPNWQLGDSANVEGTVSRTMSQDPRFYKIRPGYYRLTKNSELLSNPSWANLAYFVLEHFDKKRKGMHLQDIARRAIELKEKYSDWRRENVQTPQNTVSATMSVDHRFESLPERGYWRLAAGEMQPAREEQVPSGLESSTRDQAYEQVRACLEQLGSLTPLPFGRTYYCLGDRVHLMFRFSKAHHRGGAVEYFLGVTPQYFERIRKMGNGFMVFVLGSVDNVLVVPAGTFADWVEGLEPSGSGTWPLAFYQPAGGAHIERWVPGEGREDVSGFLNDYDSVHRALSQTPPAERKRRGPSTIRIADLFEASLLRPGDAVHTRKRPDILATAMDANTVEYQGRRLSYNDWGTHVNGWVSINVYQEIVLARTGQTLGELRKQLMQDLA
jgi:hypothetical protein